MGKSAARDLPELHPHTVQHVRADGGVQLPHVPRELIEHQRQGEREVLVLHTGADRAAAQLGGGLLDHLPFGSVDFGPAAFLLVLHLLLPAVALLDGARGSGPVQRIQRLCERCRVLTAATPAVTSPPPAQTMMKIQALPLTSIAMSAAMIWPEAGLPATGGEVGGPCRTPRRAPDFVRRL
jgi:hypothetical protein